MPFTRWLTTALLLCTCAQAQFASTSATTERDLLIRALSFGGDMRVDLMPGKWPGNFKLTLPAGSQLMGSLVITDKEGKSSLNSGKNIRIFFDHALPTAQLRASLTNQLKQAGFQPVSMPNRVFPGLMEGGFQAANPVSSDLWYHRNPDQMVFLNMQRVGQVTQVSLNVEEVRDLNLRLQAISSDPYVNLPRLAAPPNSTVVPQGGGSNGQGDANQSARIETTLSHQAAFDAYAAQLRAAGWTAVSHTQQGKILMVVWRTSKGGLGLLSLTELEKGMFKGTLAVVSDR